jgi:hypothetical protein
VRVPSETARDFTVMVSALRLPKFHPTWTRPIALLIPRTATHTFLSDASYGGLSGSSPEFSIMWRVMKDALSLYGFPMQHLDSAGEPVDFDNQGLHINPLEIIAIIINIWLALKLIEACPALASTGYIVTRLCYFLVAHGWKVPGSWRSLSCSPCIGASSLSLFSNHSFPILSYTRQAERRSGLPQLLSQTIDSLLGLRYHAMRPAGNLSNLPSAARTLINDSRDTFVTADRGQVRRRNDGILESRARHFASWLEAAGFAVHNFGLVTVGNFPSIRAAYLTAVAAGDNCLQLTALGPSAALRGYVAAASDAITLLQGTACSYLNPATVSSKRPKILPMIGEIICQRSAWKEPLPRKETFTAAMIDALCAYLLLESTKTSIARVFLISEYAVYDWLRLGLFMGSRILECGQTSSSKSLGSPFARIPNSSDAGIWANQPLAFIEADFVFIRTPEGLINIFHVPHTYS